MAMLPASPTVSVYELGITRTTANRISTLTRPTHALNRVPEL